MQAMRAYCRQAMCDSHKLKPARGEQITRHICLRMAAVPRFIGLHLDTQISITHTYKRDGQTDNRKRPTLGPAQRDNKFRYINEYYKYITMIF